MVLCKFYAQGNCRNGANCRFEHPGANPNPFSSSNNQNPNANRFGAFNNPNTGANSGFSNANNNRRDGPDSNAWNVKKGDIETDLRYERPQWILSSYGPGRDAPEQLFGGYPREQSVEEVRWHVMSASNKEAALQEVMALYKSAEDQMANALSNTDAAVQFVVSAGNKHPNRLDVCKENTPPGGTAGVFSIERARAGANAAGAARNLLTTNSQPNPFSTTNASSMNASASAFGQPSSLGAKPNPFGSAAFGQPSQLGGGAPAFGQPAQLGAQSSPFGQSSQQAQRPNPFSAAASAPSGFAQAAAQQGNAFGQPSQLGQKPNPFGAPAASASPSPFGQPQQAANTNPPANPFGQPAAPSPFGQPAQPNQGGGFATQPAPANPFASGGNQPPQQANGFAQPMSAAPTANANTPSPFGQPSQLGQTPNPFGQPAAAPNGFSQTQGTGGFAASATPNPFGQPPQPQAGPSAAPAAATASSVAGAQPPGQPNNPYGPSSAKSHPAVETYTARDMSGRLAQYKGQAVTYKDGVPGVRGFSGDWKRIWFPDGPPRFYKDTEGRPEDYSGAKGEEVKRAYEKMHQLGRFDGIMPEVPPMREACVWDF